MTNFNLEELRRDDIDIKSAPKDERPKFYRIKNLVLKELHRENRLRYVGSQEAGNGMLLHLYIAEGIPFHSPELFAPSVRMLKKAYDPICRGTYHYRISDKYTDE